MFFFLPGNSFVQTYLNLVSVLKPYWKCLNYLNSDLDNQQIIDLLKNENEKCKINNKVEYFDLSKRPEKFPLATYSKLQAHEYEVLEAKIEHEIRRTSLSNARTRTFLSICDDCSLVREQFESSLSGRFTITDRSDYGKLIEQLEVSD